MSDPKPSVAPERKRPGPALPIVLLVLGLLAAVIGTVETLRAGALLPYRECGAYALAGLRLDGTVLRWSLLLGALALVAVAGRLARR